MPAKFLEKENRHYDVIKESGGMMGKSETNDVLNWINRELQKNTGDDSLEVTENTKLLDIPNLDSVVLLNFVIAFEERFDVEVPMEEVVKNIGIDFFISFASMDKEQ